MSNDTLLILDKEAARRQSNFNLTHIELRNRFAAALTREEKLRLLWENTTEQLSTQKELNRNLEAQITLLTQELGVREEELEAVKKVSRKTKRKSFINGALLGIVGGVLTTTILLNR